MLVRFTIHASRFTLHDSRFTIYDWRFTGFGAQRFDTMRAMLSA
jgi:hypothetical protein